MHRALLLFVLSLTLLPGRAGATAWTDAPLLPAPGETVQADASASVAVVPQPAAPVPAPPRPYDVGSHRPKNLDGAPADAPFGAAARGAVPVRRGAPGVLPAPSGAARTVLYQVYRC